MLNTYQSVRPPSYDFFFLMFRLQAKDSNRMYHGFNNRPRGGQKSCPEGRLCYPPGGSHQCLDLPQCQGHARRQCQRWSYNILFSNPREFLMLSFRNRVLRICVTKVTTDSVPSLHKRDKLVERCIFDISSFRHCFIARRLCGC